MDDRKKDLAKLLNIDARRARLKKLEGELTNPDIWRDSNRAKQVSQELSNLSSLLKRFDEVKSEADLEALESEALYSGDYDTKSAILSVHAGAGGTEAQDWAEMLLRMYVRVAEKKDWKIDLLAQTRGEEAGIKSATVAVSGYQSYGFLKSEAGVHRLVRISPFDADKARHTSFALVEVVPDLGAEAPVAIDEKDIKIDVFRSSGHGGQSVNTTDSAVRITHIPTGMTVSVQNERSQLQNKARALSILQSRLQQLEESKREAKTRELKGKHSSAEWGNQIRSYVLQPYRQVKDHRTSCTSPNPNDVLSGNIDDFVVSYLKWRRGN